MFRKSVVIVVSAVVMINLSAANANVADTNQMILNSATTAKSTGLAANSKPKKGFHWFGKKEQPKEMETIKGGDACTINEPCDKEVKPEKEINNVESESQNSSDEAMPAEDMPKTEQDMNNIESKPYDSDGDAGLTQDTPKPSKAQIIYPSHMANDYINGNDVKRLFKKMTFRKSQAPKYDIETYLMLSPEQIEKAQQNRLEGEEKIKPINDEIQVIEQKIDKILYKNYPGEARDKQVERYTFEIRNLQSQANEIKKENVEGFESILTPEQRGLFEDIKRINIELDIPKL